MNKVPRKKWEHLTVAQVSEIVGRLKCGESCPDISRAMMIPECRPYHIKQGRAYKKITDYLKIEYGLPGATVRDGFEVRDTVNTTTTFCACCDSSASDPK